MGWEVNFDGLVGLTHNYSGLSYGNIASLKNQKTVSNPKQAALQGLEKMKFLKELGIPQAVLPPHERPHLATLRSLGFQGSDPQVLSQAWKHIPEIVQVCSSAASMWVANSATVCPSADSLDGLVHFTPANLSNKFHRSIEHKTTAEVFKSIFANSAYFIHHDILPEGNYFSDEGAANHMRFCQRLSEPGVQVFVYGRYAFKEHVMGSKLYPARQTFEASQAIVRCHQLDPNKVIFVQQNPRAIDAGVFHNDVISVGHQNFLFYHTSAFLMADQFLSEIQRKVEQTCHTQMILWPASEKQVSLEDAIQTYLFNSQIVTLPDKTIALIAPLECQQNQSVKLFLDEMLRSGDNPIKAIHYLNLQQSMGNGGGPACLRLRVVLTEKELSVMNQKVLLTDDLYLKLKNWIEKNYRESLAVSELADPDLLVEGQQALNELTQILGLGSIYDFQKREN